MRLTSIKITNLAAFQEFETKLPSVALIEGRHGAGKSSLQRVLCYAFGRRPLATNSRGVEHDPSILHGAAEKGEAVITFEDGPLESLRVVVKHDGTDRQIKVRGKKAWQAAGSGIDDITNALAYDPMAFRDLEPKQRLEAFLRVVPVEINKEELTEAVGGVMPLDLSGTIGLDTINAAYDDIYKLRRTESVAADTQSKHAGELEAALPPVVEGNDWNAEATRLRADKSTLEGSEAEEIRRIGKDLQAAKDHLAGLRRADEQAIDTVLSTALGDLDRQIRELENQKTNARELAAGKKQGLANTEATGIESARNAANKEAGEIKQHNAPLHAKLTADIATAEERSRSTAQAEGTRKAAGIARAEAVTRQAKAKEMTEALERLMVFKATVGSRMKIPGVTIASPREGLPVDICREEDGSLVSFENWNDFSKDQFCMKMAILFRGPCGLIVIDNLSNWSPARQADLIETCKKYAITENMQFLIGRALDYGELSVRDATKSETE